MTTRSKLGPLLGTLMVAAAAALPVLAEGDARADGVQLYVQAPYDFKTKTFDLDDLETQNLSPLFAKTVDIPYATLEPLVRDQVKQQVDRTITGTEVCPTILCPDLHFAVNIVSDFRFTQKNQPTVTSVGPASENGVLVSLHSQAEVKLNAHIHAWTSLSDSEFDVPVTLLVGVVGSVKINLFPVLKAEALDVKLMNEGSNINVVGLNGELVEIGAELGTIIGFSPIGVFFGGPILGPILALIGDEVADEVSERIRKEVGKAIDKQLQTVSPLVTKMAKDALDPALASANNLKDSLLKQKVPGINRTYEELMSTLGMSLDVRTTVKNNVIRTAATTRFSGMPQSGHVAGTLKIPKSACVYVEMSNPIIGSVKFPVDVKTVNQDLAGKSCSVINTGDISRPIYLGESPNKVLASGDPANTLASWAAGGPTTLSGSIANMPLAYECPFSITGMPNSTIFELETKSGTPLASRLGEGASSDRYMLASVLGQRLLIDHAGKLKSPDALVIGGDGPSTVDDCPSSHSSGRGLSLDALNRLRASLDPENCPNCTFTPKYRGDDRVLVLRNPEVLTAALTRVGIVSGMNLDTQVATPVLRGVSVGH